MCKDPFLYENFVSHELRRHVIFPIQRFGRHYTNIFQPTIRCKWFIFYFDDIIKLNSVHKTKFTNEI